MKQILFVLLAFSYFCCNAQKKTSADSVLKLTRNETSKPVELTIKHNKPLKIKTSTGQKLTLNDYSIIGDSAIASSTDTFAVRNVTYIKGMVKGTILRKISGVILKIAGGYFTIVGAVAGSAFMLPQAYLICVPAVGIGYVGHTLAGGRGFDTSEKWTLKISPKIE
ncbi:MAG: hypothetical protein ACO1OF_13075 [Adhaeribacter sp.]